MFDAPYTATGERRSPIAPPTGVPIVSIQQLTHAEREVLRDLRRGHAMAVMRIDEALEVGRVDRALDALHHVTDETDGLAARLAARLGAGR